MTRSDTLRHVTDDPRPNRYRSMLAARAGRELRGGETIVAMLPFSSVPKIVNGPRGRKNKVRIGIRQSWRRYRPTVLTDRRVLVFDSARTPNARELIGEFPIEDVHAVEVAPVGRFGQVRLVLDLPGLGQVPFDTGRRERRDVETFAEVLESPG